ncbi:MAG: tripartite tricarboxylate transporter permease [Thermodesulfobacteriota bacterium]|jgi:putative tricarboxylic transport membrane protein
MELLTNLYQGFQICLSPINLLYCFVGVLLGTLIGVLPGIGPGAAIALLLPTTFRVSPVSAIIMLAGIYYGAMYGGSTTSILVNIPGEAASVVTCIDGYQMARQGRAGPALGIAAFGSFIAGTLSVVGLMILAVPLSNIALQFGFPEYFAIMCLGLSIVSYLGRGSIFKSLLMAALGVSLSFVGMDVVVGKPRFDFGLLVLGDGVGLIPLLMGLFGIAEVFSNIEEKTQAREIFQTKIKGLLPTVRDWKDSLGAITRGSLLGFFLGILPGGGAVVSSFVSYAVEKKISKHPEKFGTGVIEGVAGPESANNAATGGAFIPLFVLGIPSNVAMALLLGALMIHGLQPGPLLLQQHPEIFWGTVASMYIGNAMLLVLNLPLIGLWVKLLKVPYKILFPMILLFCLIGAYSENNNASDMVVMLFFGFVGYLLRKYGYDLAPLVLAFVLGRQMEQAFRQSLILSDGSFLVFFTRPISAVAMALATFLLVSALIPAFKKKREKIEVEEI